MAALEAIVLAWWAERLYNVWSRLYANVTAIRLPWQARTEVEVEAEDKVELKRVRQHQQAAIDARNDMI